jgi:hypothetical protein
MSNFAEMNKAQLRAACKAAGIKGWGNMTTARMRDVLEAAAPVEAPKVAKAKTARAPRNSDTPSVRVWLETRVNQYGSVKLEDAKAYVAESKRSVVTMYRQAQELGLKIDREKKAFVRA